MPRPDTLRRLPLVRAAALATALAATLAATLATGGCMTSRLEHEKNTATGIGRDESVVILASGVHKDKPTEEGFLECVADRVQSGSSRVKVMPDQQFRDELFPWFEPRTMPQNADALPDVLAHPGVAERIAGRGIRYLVWVNGKTERTDSRGAVSCAVGPGGGGCFGFAWWEDQANYEAHVWDLTQKTAVGDVTADVHGTSMLPALIIPLPLIARTETAACKGLAAELQRFITQSAPGT